MTVYDPPQSATRSMTVAELLDDPALDLDVQVIAGRVGLDREITHPRIQKSGLVMVGHLHGVVPTRLQVLGETEISYAETLDEEGQRIAARHLFSSKLACVLVTRGIRPPEAFCREAERTGTPLVVCGERSSLAITALHTLMDERLAPRTRVHGVLVDVFEVGVLLLGQSGIGKSECALELVMRGHRLVADDVVECDYHPPGMIFGEAAELLRHHIEVRGLGVLDIHELYGVTAVRDRKRIDLVVEMALTGEGSDGEFDRLGLEERFHEILGVPIRMVRVPVRPGRNMSSIIEIAARSDLLRQAGHDPARDFVRRVEGQLLGGDSAIFHPKPEKPKPGESTVPPRVRPKGKP